MAVLPEGPYTNLCHSGNVSFLAPRNLGTDGCSSPVCPRVFRSRGTIEVGKTADLVLLDNDPLADIHNTRSIRAVVLNGRLFPRAALDAMLAKAQTLASPEDVGSGK